MSESFIQTFTRTAIKARFKKTDSVPILRTPIVNIFGASVAELNKMSRIERMLEHGWYAIAMVITGMMMVIGIIVVFVPDAWQKLGWFGSIALVLIWLFSTIQFLSFVGYVRYRLGR